MRLIALTALVWACAPTPPMAVRQEITDGVLDDGHPSVGQLLVPSKPNDHGTCTGILVGERTVVTAAHCLTFDGDFLFLVGGGEYVVRRVAPHPDFDPELPTMPPDHDIGLALLERAPPVAPSVLADEMPRAGSAIVLVGFGTTAEGADDGGTKRTAANVIEEVEPTRFSIVGSGGDVGNLCHGDSGGPVLVEGVEQVVVGVTSAAEGQCAKSRSWATRIDVYLDWIRSVTGDLRLPDRDPPRIIVTSPEDGAMLRSPVTVEAVVIDVSPLQRVALWVDGAEVGSVTAQPVRFEQSLAPGEHTLEVRASDALGHEAAQAVTATVVGGDSPIGADCSFDIECASETCHADADQGGAYCTRACDPDRDPCPAELECREPGPDLPTLCLRRGEEDGTGGCSVEPRGRPAGGLALLLALLMLVRRRG